MADSEGLSIPTPHTGTYNFAICADSCTIAVICAKRLLCTYQLDCVHKDCCINLYAHTTPLSEQKTEWYVHKDFCNKTVFPSGIMPSAEIKPGTLWFWCINLFAHNLI